MYPTSCSLHVGMPPMYPTSQAIDPDQPTRILSTDKKAQKAGGLCLALKGVPVKPTDDVDVDKEYQLIPIDSL